MLQKITHFMDRVRAPELDWIQVEVTTRCQSACAYCPHSVLKGHLPEKDMPLSLFSRLLPFLHYTKMIYLQGWGEPLLHPNLFDMIRMGKQLKKKVGFTTNGMGLDEENINNIIDAGVDVLGVSLAGAGSGTHDKFRRGNDFRKLMENLALLYRIKTERKSPRPDLHLAWLMLRSNFHELEEVIPLARSLGATQVVASNLTLILTPALFPEALFNNPGNSAAYIEKLAGISRAAERAGILFASSSPILDEHSTDCGENVGKACVVSIEGDVVPCVFMDPALDGGTDENAEEVTSYWFGTQNIPLKGISFGNIRNETLPRIWHKKAYGRFRTYFHADAFKTPSNAISGIPSICRHCYKRLTADQ